MKKIVFIPGIVDGMIGGAEIQKRYVADALQNLNYDIYGILPHSSIKNARYKNKFYYRKIFFNNLKIRPLYFKKIYNCLCDIKPDIIYQRGGLPFLAVAVYYCKKNNCKVIWHVASEMDVKPFQFERKKTILFDFIDKKFLEFGIRHTNYIIGHANYQNILLKNNYGRECDLVTLKFQPPPEQEIRKVYPLKVIWIANFKRMKQPEIFIQLAREFRDYNNLKFVMIGRPSRQKEWQKHLEEEIDELSNLEYLGEKPIDEVNRILCESHIFVNTSIYEGLPNTFVQAWMRKVPVVSLNIDPDDILKNKKIGFHSGSFDRLSDDLERLINNNSLREEMGKTAQSYALENHDLNQNIKKIEKFFDDVC